MEKRFGIFSSSDDPQKLGDTVKGLLIGAATLIIYIAAVFGFNVTTEQITEAAIVIGTSIASIWTVYGLVKKIIVAITARFQ